MRIFGHYFDMSWSGIRYRFRCMFVYPFQRAKNGYSNRDTWGFDYYLAEVITKVMRELRQNIQGCPMEFAYPEGFDHEPIDIEEACENWGKVLEQIAEGFEIYTKDEWWHVDNPDKEAEHAKIEEAKQLFIKHFGSFWD